MGRGLKADFEPQPLGGDIPFELSHVPWLYGSQQ